MNRSVLSFLCILMLPASLVFGAEDAKVSDDFLLDDLLQELEKVTEIATHTKLNVDYVPGMVTVLYGEDLQQKGIFTLNEALQTVPGVEVLISNEGQTKFVMRGIGESFSSGKVKFLINGRAMNAVMSAASTAGVIPMQLVDRIEIVRGSGSSIYGEYAFAGVVNVILRKDSVAYYTGSHHNTHSTGVSWSNYESESPVKVVFNISALEKKGKQVEVGSDYLDVLGLSSNSPGYSNESERSFTSALQVSYKDYHLDAGIQHQEIGDVFGFLNALPPEVEPIRKVITASSDLDKKFKLNDKLTGLASVGGRAYALRGKLHYFLPAGFPDGTGGVYEDGVLATPNYTEYEAHGNLELYYSGIKNHDFLFGFHGAYIKQGDTWAKRNWTVDDNGQLIPATLQVFRGDENWLTENNSRKIVSFYAQDQWKVIDPLTVTAGARYDKYFGIGDSLNPRLAAVYNFRDNHIFKIQYSHSFRPPTFFELYIDNNTVAKGNPNIKSEKVHVTEAGYIYSNLNTSFRVTAFYSHLHDLITVDSSGDSDLYQNEEGVISRGVEIEVSQKITHLLTFDANASVVDVREDSTDKELINIAKYLGNASVSYQPVERIKLVVSDQYTGSRKRADDDTRSGVGSYHVFNATLSMKDLLVKQTTLNFGIKNLLDTKVTHPSPLVSFAGMTLPSYAGDYPRPGREFWVNIAYKY